MANARSRVTKLEAAMMGYGSDLSRLVGGSQAGTFSGSGETSGRPHCQHGVFPRASKEASCWCSPRGGEGQRCVEFCRDQVGSGGGRSPTSRGTFAHFATGGIRCAGEPTCHSSRQFHAGIGTVARICSGYLQRERDDLRSELADQGNHAGEDGRRKKSLRSLSVPSADLSMPLLNPVTTQGASGRNPSLMMETIIDHAESTIRSGQQLMNFT